ncbi:MAG: efflux RND transporter periplasmic adaptor subunit [Alphaproteobacteria bacterium]
MNRIRFLQFGIAALAAAIIGAGLWAAWFKPVEVRIAEVRHDVPIQVFGLGTVEAQVTSQIGFETPGTLVELHADHGDTVAAGTLLARLDDREQEARAAQARAAVTQAEATVEQATANVARAAAVLKEKLLTNRRRQELVERGTTSQQVADEAQAAADVAKADVAQAQSAVGVARANLEQVGAALVLEEVRLAKYRLNAPYDGIVIKRHRELGSALTANEPVFTVVDPKTVWALAYIDEARAGAIEIGQPAQVIRRSAPDRPIPATVARIDIESDRVNEEYRIYVRCGGCPLAFHLGEQAEVKIKVATLPAAILLKVNALTNVKGQRAMVWAVENGRLRKLDVALGHRTLDGRVEIVGDLPPGAQLVEGPAAGFKEGRKAKIAPSGKTGT